MGLIGVVWFWDLENSWGMAVWAFRSSGGFGIRELWEFCSFGVREVVELGAFVGALELWEFGGL